ncbi:hypothetical protein ABK040_001714 [Willaertia magna]
MSYPTTFILLVALCVYSSLSFVGRSSQGTKIKMNFEKELSFDLDTLQYAYFVSLDIENVTIVLKLEIINCYFKDNTGVDGGAIFIGWNFGQVKLDSCTFISNTAKNNGGALYISNYIDAATMTIDNCKFIRNFAGGTSIIDTEEGNGGAIFAEGENLEISGDNVFFENSAMRGGAIFTNCFIPETKALIKSNRGRLAGGGIFLFNVDSVNYNSFDFQNNTALLYGSDRATFIKKVIVQYSIDGEEVPELVVFPGLQFNVIFKAFDLFDNPVGALLEPAEYKVNFDQNAIQLLPVSGDTGGFF